MLGDRRCMFSSMVPVTSRKKLNPFEREYLYWDSHEGHIKPVYANPWVPSTAPYSLIYLSYPIEMSALSQFRLPDPLAHWPWPRTLNPHYAEVKPESDAWLRGLEALDAKSQRSFDRCNFGKYISFYPVLQSSITLNTFSPSRWPRVSTD
jgi:hypothetical protein